MIRKEAGYKKSYDLSNTILDQQRRAAETVINTASGALHTVPFKPVPEIVHTPTIKLAAAMLVQNRYPGSIRSTNMLRDARAAIKAIQDGEQTIVDDGDQSVGTATGGVAFWPNETAYRAFQVADSY